MQIETQPMSIYDPAGYPSGVPNPYGPRVHAWQPDDGGPFNEGTRYHGPVYGRPQWGAPWINQPLWGVGSTGGSSPWGLIFFVGAIAAAGLAVWYFTEGPGGQERRDDDFKDWYRSVTASSDGWYVRAYREGDRRPKEIYGPFDTKAEADARKASETTDDYWGRLTVGKYASGEQALG